MDFINLTRDTLTVEPHGLTLPPAPMTAALMQFPANTSTHGHVRCVTHLLSDTAENLPAPRRNVTYITTKEVAQAAARLDRTDVVAPDLGPDAERVGSHVTIHGFIKYRKA